MAGGSVAHAATTGGVKMAYFDQWSVYQNAYYLKNVDSTGVADNLDYLLYDFEDIDPTNLTCFEATKATDPDPGGRTIPTPATARRTSTPSSRWRSRRATAWTAWETPTTSRCSATSTS